MLNVSAEGVNRLAPIRRPSSGVRHGDSLSANATGGTG